MGDIVEFPKQEKDGDKKYAITYIYDDNYENIIGVTHPDWPFRIHRVDGEIAIVDESTDEPFGILDADVFNTILACWLIIDAPHLITGQSSD